MGDTILLTRAEIRRKIYLSAATTLTKLFLFEEERQILEEELEKLQQYYEDQNNKETIKSFLESE